MCLTSERGPHYRRWVNADSADVDAQIALWQRMAAEPNAADPDRPSLLAALESLLAKHPNHLGTREALVTALADAGEPDRGRALLDTWPESTRDARYWRLRGRWNLEYDHHPDQAAAAFQTALVELRQDWRSWYRLARAFAFSTVTMKVARQPKPLAVSAKYSIH